MAGYAMYLIWELYYIYYMDNAIVNTITDNISHADEYMTEEGLLFICSVGIVIYGSKFIQGHIKIHTEYGSTSLHAWRDNVDAFRVNQYYSKNITL